jgi:hypothetical protein
LRRAGELADIHSLGSDEVADYLAGLGERLLFRDNRHMREAYELSRLTSGLSDSLLLRQYEEIPALFSPSRTRALMLNAGLKALDGWVRQHSPGGEQGRSTFVRAFGARTVHIIAGNAPVIAAATIINGALTRSDTIIKAPSNDPLTAVAIARTMAEWSPHHPITRHLAVAYWKGGDASVEEQLFQPSNVDKVVAWGGHGGMSSIRRVMQPGIDLIALDPKLSGSIIEPSADGADGELATIASQLAKDVGALNQEACFNSRVAYVLCDGSEPGLERANRLGRLTMEAIRRLPQRESTPHKAFDPELQMELEGIRFAPDQYHVFGGHGAEGAVIVSQRGSPVDFAHRLACRVVNIVPIGRIDEALEALGSVSQTVGVYPDALRARVRESLALRGVQRIVPLGATAAPDAPGAPHDGLELLRRMCRWCVESREPDESN